MPISRHCRAAPAASRYAAMAPLLPFSPDDASCYDATLRFYAFMLDTMPPLRYAPLITLMPMPR